MGEEMQKDVPSTKVIVPDPTGPAAVSAFHPAIPAPLSNQRPAPGLSGMQLPGAAMFPQTLLLLAFRFQSARSVTNLREEAQAASRPSPAVQHPASAAVGSPFGKADEPVLVRRLEEAGSGELGPEPVQPGESPLRRARSLSSRAPASIASTRVAGLLLLEGFRSMRSVPREPRKGK